jgi:DNA-binding SARP family transcriptional activator
MLELRLLGPVQLLVDGEAVALPAKQRALLVALAVHAPQALTHEQLVDLVWDDAPPGSAVKALQVYATQLRKTLGGRLRTVGGGYALVLADDELDVARFEQLLAARALGEALALWRGPALADMGEPFARRTAARLDEERLTAAEDLADARPPSVGDLELRVADHPERERGHAQLMLALYRAGRQEDALAVYRRARTALVERAGLEPGPELRELHERILRHDPTLARRPADAARPPGARRPTRAWAVAAGVVVVVALAGAGARLAELVRGEPNPDAVALRGFVVKTENFLDQSHDARDQITAAISGAARCSTSPSAAADAIGRVQRSRQSLLQQLAAVSVPPEALPVFDALQRATRASIEADWRYRDWLRTRRTCTRGAAPPQSVRVADARATRLKRDFVAVFEPLAVAFHARTWSPTAF